MEDSPIQPDETITRRVRAHTLAIPAAIVFGFVLVSAAIFFSEPTQTQQNTTANNTQQTQTQQQTGSIAQVNSSDHIRGNPNAPIVIVEYADYDCPFCKDFHDTMQLIMENYGADGTVAWVYRHLPIQHRHPSALHIAAASECVAELGGNDAFWQFSDLVFSQRGEDQFTNTARLGEFAASAGVDENAFNTCLTNGETRSLVEEDFNDGTQAGADGTPYSVMLVADQQYPISGARSYDYISQLLNTTIGQLENTPVAE